MTVSPSNLRKLKKEKQNMNKIMTTIVLLGALCAFSGCILGKSGPDFGFGSGFIYDHAKQYTAGDAKIDDKVQAIDLDWVSGNVNVIPSPDDTVTISEITDGTLPEEQRVHWWLDGTTLRIKFCASGLKLRFHYGKKALTVAVPESLQLSDIHIDSASADVQVSTAKVNDIHVDTASGDVTIENCLEVQNVRISTASGKQTVIIPTAETAQFGTASGSISIRADSIKTLKTNTASGDVRCELQKAPDDCSMETSSGKVTVGLPEDIGFTLKLGTASGRLESDFALKKSGSTFICGDASSRMKINTASGDIRLFAN